MSAELIVAVVIAAIVAIVVVLVRRLMRRAREIGELTENGRVAVAILNEKRAQRRSRVEDHYFITYAFHASSGLKFSRQLRVTETEYKNYAEGQELEIIYLPSSPDINTFKSVVDKTRDAMQAPAQ